MRLVIKAILKDVEEIVLKENLRFQYILLEKPIYDQFEGQLMRTDYFPATLFNDKIDNIDAINLLGKKVECVCYLNSQEVKKDDRTFHNLRLKVTEMKELVVPVSNSSE